MGSDLRECRGAGLPYSRDGSSSSLLGDITISSSLPFQYAFSKAAKKEEVGPTAPKEPTPSEWCVEYVWGRGLLRVWEVGFCMNIQSEIHEWTETLIPA